MNMITATNKLNLLTTAEFHPWGLAQITLKYIATNDVKSGQMHGKCSTLQWGPGTVAGRWGTRLTFHAKSHHSRLSWLLLRPRLSNHSK